MIMWYSCSVYGCEYVHRYLKKICVCMKINQMQKNIEAHREQFLTSFNAFWKLFWKRCAANGPEVWSITGITISRITITNTIRNPLWQSHGRKHWSDLTLTIHLKGGLDVAITVVIRMAKGKTSITGLHNYLKNVIIGTTTNRFDRSYKKRRKYWFDDDYELAMERSNAATSKTR